jgi:N6-adenosine-specific RNA methylase IME4/ParB-like chromosome segregation protein Spo0J
VSTETTQVELVKIDAIKVSGRVRKDFGDLGGLATSISELGLLQPIGIDKDGRLVFGERRLLAYRMLGRDEIPARVIDIEDLVLGEHAENEIRKDFNPSERVEIGKRVEEVIGKRQGERTDLGLRENFPEVETGKRTAEIAAEKAGFGNYKTYEQAKQVVAKGTPALIRAMDSGAVAISAAAKLAKEPPEFQKAVVSKIETGQAKHAKEAVRQIKREQHARKVEEAAQAKEEATVTEVSEPLPLPNLVLADPPWKYDHQEAPNREVENHYQTRTVEEICAHCPATQDNAALFLWATAPKLKEALQVMDAWGFAYKTHAIWDKEHVGMGYWFRGQHELLLVGVKGSFSPTPEAARQSSVFREKRSDHSRKPACVYEWIEYAFPDAVKLEMYCRSPRPGWQVLGDEV